MPKDELSQVNDFGGQLINATWDNLDDPTSAPRRHSCAFRNEPKWSVKTFVWVTWYKKDNCFHFPFHRRNGKQQESIANLVPKILSTSRQKNRS